MTAEAYALPLLRTWLLAIKPNSCLCCDKIGQVDQRVYVRNGTTMIVTLYAGQLSVTWEFEAVKSKTRHIVANEIKTIKTFKHQGENCSFDMCFAHIMRQAVQPTESLGLTLSSVLPGIILDVNDNSLAEQQWGLQPQTKITRIDGMDVSDRSSAVIATALMQHPRPREVQTIPAPMSKWIIPTADGKSKITLNLHQVGKNVTHASELMRAVNQSNLQGELKSTQGHPIKSEHSLWNKFMLCFHPTDSIVRGCGC